MIGQNEDDIISSAILYRLYRIKANHTPYKEGTIDTKGVNNLNSLMVRSIMYITS